jgi:hypothetical protein
MWYGNVFERVGSVYKLYPSHDYSCFPVVLNFPSIHFSRPTLHVSLSLSLSHYSISFSFLFFHFAPFLVSSHLPLLLFILIVLPTCKCLFSCYSLSFLFLILSPDQLVLNLFTKYFLRTRCKAKYVEFLHILSRFFWSLLSNIFLPFPAFGLYLP